MSERYARLFQCAVPQSQKDVPVLLSAGVLLGDRQTGCVLAQLKLQNIGEKCITAVYASVMCVDAMNVALETPVEARYLDLQVQPGATFAERQPIVIPDNTVRSFTLRVTHIMFSDGTSCAYGHDAAFEVIPEFANQYTPEQIDQLRVETGKTEAATSQAAHGCFKRCFCGQWNLQSNDACVGCGVRFEEMAALADPAWLKQRYEERKKAEAEEAEQRRIRAEQEAERQRIAKSRADRKAALEAARAKKRAMILVPSLTLVAVLLFLGVSAIQKNNRYQQAAGYMQAQNFIGARAALTELGSYKDAELLLQELAADELYASGEYAAAYDLYAQLPEAYQIHEAEYAARYEYAAELVSTASYQEAVAAFAQLGNYRDSAAQCSAAQYAYNEKLAADYLSAGDYASARTLYASLGNEDMATECLYLQARAQETTAPWLSYADYIELGDYRDSSSRAVALYGQRFETMGAEDVNGLRTYFDPEAQGYGLLDAQADVCVEPLYSDISLNIHGGYTVCLSDRYGVLAADGQYMIEPQYDSIAAVEDTDLYLVGSNEKTGLLKTDGTVVIPAEYDAITWGENEYYVTQNKKEGIFSAEGVMLVSPAYDDIVRMDDGRFMVSVDAAWGVIDPQGKTIVDVAYDTIALENTGTYTVSLDGLYGIVAYDGTEIHTPSLQGIMEGSNDGRYLRFKQDGLYGFLDAATFEIVVPAEWKNATIMYDGYAYIYNNLDQWGVISASGEVVVSPRWENIQYFADCGYALRSESGGTSNQCLLMNKRGTVVIDFSKHDDRWSSHTAKYLGKGCFANRGDTVLYDTATSTTYSYQINEYDVTQLRKLDNGFIAGYYHNQSWDYVYGVIDPDIPQLLSNCYWEEAISILPSRNRVGDKYGWINEQGVDLIRPVYDYIRPFPVGGYIIAAKYNDRGNLVYMLLDAASGSLVVGDLKTEADAICAIDPKAMEGISLHEEIIVSLMDMGFTYESSEAFLAALLAENDSTARSLYNQCDSDYGSELYNFWKDIQFDINAGRLNTEEKVWQRLRVNSMLFREM